MTKKEIKIRKVTELEIQNLKRIKEALFSVVSAHLLENGAKPGDTVRLTIGNRTITIPIDNYVFHKMEIAGYMH